MKAKNTEIPLHELVITAMYNASKEKAAEFTPSDVLWRLDDPDLNEKQIAEVLDWLVKERRVNSHLGKYTLDRYEFLEQKKIEQNAIELANKKDPLLTETVKNPKKWVNALLLIISISTFSYTSYLFSTLNYEQETKDTEYDKLDSVNKSSSEKIKLKRLYLSGEEEPETFLPSIASSFRRQNANNKMLLSELQRIEQKIDSLQILNKTRSSRLDQEITKKANIRDLNEVIDKITLSNLILLFIVIVLFIRGL